MLRIVPAKLVEVKDNAKEMTKYFSAATIPARPNTHIIKAERNRPRRQQADDAHGSSWRRGLRIFQSRMPDSFKDGRGKSNDDHYKRRDDRGEAGDDRYKRRDGRGKYRDQRKISKGSPGISHKRPSASQARKETSR